MRWVPAALLVALTATACSGGDGDPAAAASTPTPTPSSDLLDGSDPPQGLRPAVTASPEATGFLWAPIRDEASGSNLALPEGARPIANTIPGPDGTTVITRGFVFEHDDGVIGFEMIDDYATLDDLEKMADFLAASVGGAVVATEEVDVGQERGIDGEVVYGDDQLMLFRILVLNSDGDVWSGFAGGPEEDRERLESEFTRLTDTAFLRPAGGPVAVLDEPSGITVELPDRVPPEDRSPDGSTPVRGYHHDDGLGFVVVDGRPDGDDLDAALANVAVSVEGTVESSALLDVRGHHAIDGVVIAGEWTYLMRVIHLEERTLVVYAAGKPDERQRLTDDVDRMTESFVVP
ncbi:hypothetical protein [Jiangella anatolica]|uniref:DUF1795 domain-containing protein n=1 Tax=Jiangella anatolica TaxID=2670374 RepID=A0A2W2BGA6_9ACTN|nr:hypothetical protein [Jiangella anatolica]PZF85022.1 hypothetical protein C1I92_06955 [Jiangella anatolica]